MSFLVRLVVNALALAAAAWLFDGIEVGGADTSDRVVTLLVVALIFGLVNAFVAPVVKLVSLPFIILTLGLLLLVINALMLLLTSRLAEAFELDFTVDGFWSAVLGSIVISIVGAVLNGVLQDD
ncbi:phage holin family protein [Nocardioides caldifontis]|uniref:phage holin family protein n=1 Tax=Nocardioides caldifontis TaxID=2588938 RepID=UPI0011DF2CF1|nr:phage holin family protein [Nocardioides caldifontis]